MAQKLEVKRLYVEKKETFADEARTLLHDLQTTLGLTGLQAVRILIRYDYQNIDPQIEAVSLPTIFSEPPVDHLYLGDFPHQPDDFVMTVELLPGQYDQRADSAAQCIQLLGQSLRPSVRAAKTYVFSGDLPEPERNQIRRQIVNPVDSRLAAESLPETLEYQPPAPQPVATIHGFIDQSPEQLEKLIADLGLAMSANDLHFCQQYFSQEEKRDPTLTEIRLLDTYWSDHCRHTTFTTLLDQVEIETGSYAEPIRKAWLTFKAEARPFFDPERELTLMRMATLSMKRAKRLGQIPDLEESSENNACSIIRPVDVDGRSQPWLIMFKNETHNHPTEIEPFGGAATCLGGAIRDPLSGRSYVYQAMRISGAAAPTQPLTATLPGKLPQRKICREAAAGFSAYGNQIGLATGLVHEYYHPGYMAKRMEVGAVIAAVPQAQVCRQEPLAGDKVVLIGGRTGRDGIGGATGSSKTHSESSLETAGSEVQKGNPPEERKLQRLFRNPDFTLLVKKSNDFGAGGVSVAIGELAAGLEIELDKVTKKYEGLDGTELAVSESQERMAVVVAPANTDRVLALADSENLEANIIATVTEQPRLRMIWQGKTIVDLARSFLDSSGLQPHSTVQLAAPEEKTAFFDSSDLPASDIKTRWLSALADLNVCSQQSLNERFDNTIGAGTVHMPYGGRCQNSPIETMIAKIPVLNGETTTASAMTYGFDPDLSQWSPFHGGLYAIVEALAKIVASGVDYHSVRFSLQEYFEKPRLSPQRWAKPFAALLGANFALSQLGLAAIGGKDSMSGSFNQFDVPPTLIAFAVSTLNAAQAVSPEFKAPHHRILLLQVPIDKNGMPELNVMTRHFESLHRAIQQGQIAAARAVHRGGIASALTKMSAGNELGATLTATLDESLLFKAMIGSIVIEWQGSRDPSEFFHDHAVEIGKTSATAIFSGTNLDISLTEALAAWQAPLEEIYPRGKQSDQAAPNLPLYPAKKHRVQPKIAVPRVIIPVFPGSNCEYDCQNNFNRVGARAKIFVFRNQNPSAITESLTRLTQEIDQAQILMLPGGFSAGDEPDGSGKFIAAVLANRQVYEAIQRLLLRQGLILGICNGFQALIKTGLLPYGELRLPGADSPTLTFNRVGRHLSRIAYTRIVSTLTPWLWNRDPGEFYQLAISHGEGRFVAPDPILHELSRNGQIATQYVSGDGLPGTRYADNPNGSLWAIEGISSPNGLIFGKMGHNERFTRLTLQNIPGDKDDRLFSAGVDFFR